MNKRNEHRAHRPTKRTVSISPKHSPIIKRWRDLSSQEKMRAATIAAKNLNGHAVTLNLAPDVEEDLRSHPDPIRFLQKRMHKELALAGMQGLPILMALELTRTPLPRLHLHGVFVPGEFSVKAIQQVMRKAANYIPGCSGSRQFKSKPLYHADGWSRYMTMDFGFTRKMLQIADSRDLWWISHSMTRLAKDHHGEKRLGQAANLSTAPSSLAS